MLELQELGYIGLFLGSFLSATIIPFSSEVLFTYLITQGYSPWSTIVIASIGNSLGGLSTYYIGWLGKTSWISKWFGMTEKNLTKLKTNAARYGVYSALLCWTPIFGDFIALALGYLKVNSWKFTIYMTIGKTARYIALYYSIEMLTSS